MCFLFEVPFCSQRNCWKGNRLHANEVVYFFLTICRFASDLLMKLYFLQWQPYIACTYRDHQVPPRAFALASRDTVNLPRIEPESVKGKSQLSIPLSNLDTLKYLLKHFAGRFWCSRQIGVWGSALLITLTKVTVWSSIVTGENISPNTSPLCGSGL